jgi:acyl-CoA reductase-like NAD-dependent aldehyde dehydrogenase
VEFSHHGGNDDRASGNPRFYLDGRWVEDGDVVEVRAPLRRQRDRTRRAGPARACRSCDRRGGQGFRNHAAPARLRDGSACCGAFRRDCRAPKEEFSRTLALEAGKPIKLARHRSRPRHFHFQRCAEESTRIYGEYLPLDWQEFTAGRWGIVRRFPLGPIAGITPFNFPLNLVAHKVAPAIAAGCSMVLKPAPQTPLCSLLAGRVRAAGGLA